MTQTQIAQRILNMPLVQGFEHYDYTIIDESMMKKFFDTSYKPKALEQEIHDAEHEYARSYHSRYVLFECTFHAPWFPQETDLGTYFPQLRRKEVRNQKEGESLKHYLLRFTTPGGLSHLGIAGSFVHEWADALGEYLHLSNLKLHQTNHNEPLCIAATQDYYLKVLGGGFFSINPQRKDIRFFGKSKTFRTMIPDAKELAGEEFNSQPAFNRFASGVMAAYVKEKGMGYRTRALRR